MISTTALLIGMPPDDAIGLPGSKLESRTVTMPVSVRSSNNSCVPLAGLSTACTTTVGVVFGIVISLNAHDATTTSDATAVIPSAVEGSPKGRRSLSLLGARGSLDSLRSLGMTVLELNRDTGRREEGELADRLPRRRALCIVEHVQKHVLRLVRVDDAQVRSDRHPGEPGFAAGAEDEP